MRIDPREGVVWQRDGIVKRPGVYQNMTLEAYHDPDICDGPSVSSSTLRTLFLESPAHYWAFSPYNDERFESKPNKALIFGRAAHHILLGQEAFSEAFAVAPERVQTKAGEWTKWTLKTDAAKAFVAAEKKRGREVLSPDEYVGVLAMGESLKRDPIIAAGALNGYVERSAFWKDRETGFWLKIRPDVIPTASGDFVDMKTAASVQHYDIVNAIHEHGYDMQMAMMRIGFRELKIEFASCSLVFVEKEPPYCVRIVTLSDADLERGERKMREALRSFARCWKSGHWPGPGGERRDAEMIYLPEWCAKADEARLKFYGEEAT